jgi:4-amino-4-deoxy-L-arabinose transferase-like glycosyltransferase
MVIKSRFGIKCLGFEHIFLAVVLSLSFFVRFSGLGYSHYYGDEIKTLYLDKTVPASQFLLDQRKGPVQFFATWFMEKVTGGYSETWIRLPYVFASVLSVLVFYLFVKKLFGKTSAYYSSLIYAFSGFSIAFGRTAQYQSFLMLFGFLSMLFILLYKEKKKAGYLLGSAFFWALSLYSHYDAIFFLFPIVMLYVEGKPTKKSILTFLGYFILPAFLILLPFYLPYSIRGYLTSNTVDYVLRRVSGSGYLPNSSLLTVSVYNPLYVFILLLIPGLFSFLFKTDSKLRAVYVWFLAAFLFYEIYISNPGTHIQNYLIPLIVLSGFVLSKIVKYIKYPLIPIFAVYILIGLLVYVPSFHTGYPWKNSTILGISVPKIEGRHQLFLYGFPYNRGWDKIQSYFKEMGGARGVYTNDNDSLAEYYLMGVAYTRPGTNFLPQYYIHVEDSQEINNPKEVFLSKNISSYHLEKEILNEGQVVASIYKLIN